MSVEAVLFDFHGTIAQVEPELDWVLAAAAACGVTVDPARATALADQLITAGRAGGPLPAKVPLHLAEAWADRDLSGSAHRAAYSGLAATIDSEIPGLADALYDRLLQASGWQVYEDVAPTMKALVEAGIGVAVVSNIGFDIRTICDDLGFGSYVGGWALSFEVGRCKPDPEIFRHACDALGVAPQRALMVGDTPADAGAVKAGCRALILPESPVGATHGLGAVLSLALG